MDQFHYLNGKILSKEEAVIGINDLAIVRGYGTFDYFQIKNSIPIHMEEHIDRFFRSIKFMHLKTSLTKSDLIKAIDNLIVKNTITDAGIKLIATGGQPDNGFNIDEANIAIIVQGYGRASSDQINNGVRLLSYEYQRLLPHIKSTNYLYAVYVSNELQKANAIEPLYYTSESVRETARANIMAVIDGKLVTPGDKILKGITRQTIIDHTDMGVEIRNMTINELKNADEVFICGTTKLALGVVQIDNETIGNGSVGQVTMKTRSMLEEIESNIVNLLKDAK